MVFRPLYEKNKTPKENRAIYASGLILSRWIASLCSPCLRGESPLSFSSFPKSQTRTALKAPLKALTAPLH